MARIIDSRDKTLTGIELYGLSNILDVPLESLFEIQTQHKRGEAVWPPRVCISHTYS